MLGAGQFHRMIDCMHTSPYAPHPPTPPADWLQGRDGVLRARAAPVQHVWLHAPRLQRPAVAGQRRRLLRHLEPLCAEPGGSGGSSCEADLPLLPLLLERQLLGLLLVSTLQMPHAATYQRCNSSLWLPQEGAKELPGWLTRDDLQALVAAAHFISCPDSVKWFPEYGCALLALPPHEAAAGHLSLSLVGLDDWSFHMHRCCQAASQYPWLVAPAHSHVPSRRLPASSRQHATALVLAGQTRPGPHFCRIACPAD
jgi:hypothetical protein